MSEIVLLVLCSVVSFGLGFALAAIVSQQTERDYSIRVRMLRRTLATIARNPRDADSEALEALAEDDVLSGKGSVDALG